MTKKAKIITVISAVGLVVIGTTIGIVFFLKPDPNKSNKPIFTITKPTKFVMDGGQYLNKWKYRSDEIPNSIFKNDKINLSGTLDLQYTPSSTFVSENATFTLNNEIPIKPENSYPNDLKSGQLIVYHYGKDGKPDNMSFILDLYNNSVKNYFLLSCFLENHSGPYTSKIESINFSFKY